MPAFITLASFTDQGARAIKDSPERHGVGAVGRHFQVHGAGKFTGQA